MTERRPFAVTDQLDRLKSALARYTIERKLGAGGMATVYLAHDAKHNRKVVIMVLRPELAASIGAERFLREIEISAQLNVGLSRGDKERDTATHIGCVTSFSLS